MPVCKCLLLHYLKKRRLRDRRYVAIELLTILNFVLMLKYQLEK